MRSTVVCLLGTLLLGCEEAPPLDGCTDDGACSAGAVCHEGSCVAPARLDCVPGAQERPGIRVQPEAIGRVATIATSRRSIQVQSTGSCTLVVASAFVEGDGPLSCEDCDRFPQSILPGRSLDVMVSVTPDAGGSGSSALIFRSNAGEVQVPVMGSSPGIPVASASPAGLNFGFVPEGEAKSLVVQVVNSGAGAALLQVLQAAVEPPGSPFSVTAEPALPAAFGPVRQDASARLALTVRFSPTARAAHSAGLRVTAAVGEPLLIPLQGAESPPRMALSEQRVDFGMVRLGREARRELAVQNTGLSPLEVKAEIDGAGPDLDLADALDTPLAPGAVRPVVLRFSPTAPGALSAALRLRSNDPDNREATLMVSGSSSPEPVEVLSLELSYARGPDSPLDRDLRKVSLRLESPDGRLCGKGSAGSWGELGACRWTGSGPFENPERIVLSDVIRDGRYPVLLSYEEDCSSLPTALTAALLGIGVDELVDALTEEDTRLPPGALAAAIEQACVRRRSAPGTLTVRANGNVLSNRPVEPAARGDQLRPLVLVRGPGGFSVE